MAIRSIHNLTILTHRQTGVCRRLGRIMNRPNTSGLIQPSCNCKTVPHLRRSARSEPRLVSADPGHSNSRWHWSVWSTRWSFHLHSVSFVQPCIYWRSRNYIENRDGKRWYMHSQWVHLNTTLNRFISKYFSQSTLKPPPHPTPPQKKIKLVDKVAVHQTGSDFKRFHFDITFWWNKVTSEVLS